MMIERSIFARSNAILSDQNFCQQIRFSGLEGFIEMQLLGLLTAQYFAGLSLLTSEINPKISDRYL